MALSFAIDANRVIDYCRDDPVTVARVRSARHVLVPLIVVGELRAGLRLTARRQNERCITRLLSSPRTSILYPDDATCHVYANVFADLRRAGTPIPTNDIWIAALVIQHGVALFSNDSHFDHVLQIVRI